MTRVSVVIPVHNGAKYLLEGLGSVLAQSRPADEIIVVDDGSTDGSAAIAASFAPNAAGQRPAGSGQRPAGLDQSAEGFRVRVLSQANRGPGAARNRGVEQSTGEFLGFLDADDLWAPEKLEWQLAAFESDPALDLVSGQVQNFLSPELDPDLGQRIGFARDPIAGMHPGAMLIRREVFPRVGPFSEDLSFGDFIPWLARAKDMGLRTRFLDRVVMFRRIHETNFSRTHQHNRRDYLAAAKQVLDRRRGRI